MSAIRQDLTPPDAVEGGERSPQPFDAVMAAARAETHKKPADLTAGQAADALAWFLSAEDETDQTHTFEINVGSPTDKHWIEWTIKPVEIDQLRRIRKRQQPNRQQRRSMPGGAAPEVDETAANIAIVIEGTVSPDLRDASRQLGAISPEMVVQSRFEHKPGLLAQIANEILALSGYDDDDIRALDAAAQG